MELRLCRVFVIVFEYGMRSVSVASKREIFNKNSPLVKKQNTSCD